VAIKDTNSHDCRYRLEFCLGQETFVGIDLWAGRKKTVKKIWRYNEDEGSEKFRVYIAIILSCSRVKSVKLAASVSLSPVIDDCISTELVISY
jgi:hypothetical protein